MIIGFNQRDESIWMKLFFSIFFCSEDNTEKIVIDVRGTEAREMWRLLTRIHFDLDEALQTLLPGNNNQNNLYYDLTHCREGGAIWDTGNLIIKTESRLPQSSCGVDK